jgi:hypothetical protein
VTFALLLATACAHLPPATLVPAEGQVVQFAIEAGDRTFAGLAVVDVSWQAVRLQALTPLGTEAFRVEVGPTGTTVTAPDPAWATALARFPFERDLRLAHGWSCPEGTCTAGDGCLTEIAVPEGVERQWRGPGGTAVARVSGGRVVLEDHRRGYRITLVEVSGDP